MLSSAYSSAVTDNIASCAHTSGADICMRTAKRKTAISNRDEMIGYIRCISVANWASRRAIHTASTLKTAVSSAGIAVIAVARLSVADEIGTNVVDSAISAIIARISARYETTSSCWMTGRRCARVGIIRADSRRAGTNTS
jgi:hypothetical protein